MKRDIARQLGHIKTMLAAQDIAFPSIDLCLDSLSLQRGNLTLIENLTLSFTNKDLCFITGENGIGKTSLLLVLAGLLRPESGQITYHAGMDRLRETDCVSLVSQPDGASRGLSAAEDLSFFLTLAGRKFITLDLLQQVGLANARNVKTESLSLGQRKRLSLAKIIGMNRPVWLLDEPFSALDKEGRDLVADCIAVHLDKGGICLIATHHPVPIKGSKAKTLHLSHTSSQSAVEAAG